MTRIKVCCILSAREAALAEEAGASALGLVSSMPSGPGVISELAIAEIASRVPPGIATFLLTSEDDPGMIVEQQRRCRTNTLQLCRPLTKHGYAHLREALPGVALVQVIHVTGEEALAPGLQAASQVNALLLDTGSPDAPTPELGGTGRTHDWSVSRRIRDEAGVPVFLAGGLKPDNVREAIAAVRPYGVDVCSGLRTDGNLDPRKLNAFVDEVHASGSAR